MPDDLETRMRRLISDAEADIGFDRDARLPRPSTGSFALREAMEFWLKPVVTVMHAMWWPGLRR